LSGKFYIYRAGGSLADPPVVEDVADPVEPHHLLDMLERLRTLVSDDIEQVPYFDRVAVSGEAMPCVAFCGENGKSKNLRINRRATALWRAAISQHNDIPTAMSPMLRDDVLVGDVVIVTGDKEFMESL
jgi:hypothetical protein